MYAAAAARAAGKRERLAVADVRTEAFGECCSTATERTALAARSAPS